MGYIPEYTYPINRSGHILLKCGVWTDLVKTQWGGPRKSLGRNQLAKKRALVSIESCVWMGNRTYRMFARIPKTFFPRTDKTAAGLGR